MLYIFSTPPRSFKNESPRRFIGIAVLLDESFVADMDFDFAQFDPGVVFNV